MSQHKEAPRPPRGFAPPTGAEVADYAAGLGMGNPPALARQFIACYAPAWRDTLDRPVRNWKLKFRQVWARRKPRPHQRAQTQKPVGNWML